MGEEHGDRIVGVSDIPRTIKASGVVRGGAMVIVFRSASAKCSPKV